MDARTGRKRRGGGVRREARCPSSPGVFAHIERTSPGHVSWLSNFWKREKGLEPDGDVSKAKESWRCTSSTRSQESSSGRDGSEPAARSKKGAGCGRGGDARGVAKRKGLNTLGGDCFISKEVTLVTLGTAFGAARAIKAKGVASKKKRRGDRGRRREAVTATMAEHRRDAVPPAGKELARWGGGRDLFKRGGGENHNKKKGGEKI